MTTLAFQAKATLQSAVEQSPGVWEVTVGIVDNEGLFTAASVVTGDIFVFDTGVYEAGTLTRYTISSITSVDQSTGTLVAVAVYDLTNNNAAGSPDLTFCIGFDGIITRKSPNLGLLSVTSPSVQVMSDRFSFYLTNYNMQNIVDKISTQGGGGGTAVKPDWNALSTDPAGILNKPTLAPVATTGAYTDLTGTPTLGTSASHDVAATGNASALQVVLGSDTRLSSQVLTNATGTPTTIGGIAAGTTFNNIPVETVLLNLLYPYQSPAFSAFALSGQTTPIEVGASVTGGARTFTWSTTNSINVATNSISIIDVTNGNTSLASALANTGSTSINLTSVTKITATTHQWKIQATNTQSVALSTTYTVTWQWKRFYGESTSTSLINTEIQALRVGGLASGFAGTYSFNAGGYKYIAYPTSFGTATSFKDQSTNLDVPFQTVQVINITNVNGIATNYNVHRTTNVLGSAINIVVA